jgi:hypothetical protein
VLTCPSPFHGHALLHRRLHERRDHERGVDRLVGERHRHLAEAHDLELDVLEREPAGFDDLADLVRGDRSAPVGRDGPALEVGRLLDRVRQVGPQQQVVKTGRGIARADQLDREALLQRVEEVDRDRAGADLQPIGGQQRRHVGRRLELLDLEIDAGLREPALLDRDVDRPAGQRADIPHHDLGLGRGAPGNQRRGSGER